MQSSLSETEMDSPHKKRRLKVFSQFSADDSSLLDRVPNSTHLEYLCCSPSLRPGQPNTIIPPLIPPCSSSHKFAPEELKGAEKKGPKKSIKPSKTLKISSIAYDRLLELQKMLTQFGAIESLENSRIHEGILVVCFFDIDHAKMAFRKLLELRHENQDLTVSYIYDKKAISPTFLSSIHESSESNKSEEGSDTEKKLKTPSPKGEESISNEDKAKELLEQKAALLAQEYDEPAIEVHGNATEYESVKVVPIPQYPSPQTQFMNTMPLPSQFLLGSQSPSLNSTTRFPPSFSFVDKKSSFSELSINSDTLSEGPKINHPPKLPPGFQYSHSPVFFHTESTANVDSDEALSSSGRFDRDLFSSSCYSPNPQLLRTQPIKKITAHPPIHTHTKSYDYDYLNQFRFPSNPYLLPSYQYYPTYYDPGYISLEEPLDQYYPMHSSGYQFGGSKGGRRRNPEREEEKAQFTIFLENVLYKKDTRTTLMIKNIPNKYHQKMLLSEIDEKYKGQYDFFYLPIDFQNKCNVGYAFINFVSPIFILDFYERYNGHKWDKFNSEKICRLAYARIQGKQALQQHFQASSIMNQQNKKVKPLILSVPAPSAAALNEYEKIIRQTMTMERIKEIERMNTVLFGSK